MRGLSITCLYKVDIHGFLQRGFETDVDYLQFMERPVCRDHCHWQSLPCAAVPYD